MFATVTLPRLLYIGAGAVAETAAVPCSLKSSRAVCNMRSCVSRVAIGVL